VTLLYQQIKPSLTDFKAKMNKSKINKYKINNNNKTNTKHELNVKYERYKQDINAFWVWYILIRV
jgi:hypothetical protein